MEGLSNINIEYSDQYGRYLVAAKDLKQGDVILREKALTIGPKIKGDLVCLNCYNVFYKRFHVCTHCKLAPLCGPICEDHQGGHTELECKVFSSIREKLTVPQLLDSYHIVTILRCLALRQLEDQKSWSALMNLESHIEKRKGTSIWEFHEISNKIISHLDLITSEDLGNNLIQMICALIDINCFELRTPLNGQGQSNIDSICGIYATAAMMAHSCICNTHLSIDDSYVITVRAATAIEKGKPIFFNYTNALHGTVERRLHLKEGKYFDCYCERCLDATELNTMMSSVKCSDCLTGMVIMLNTKNISQYSKEDVWKCLKCDKQYFGDKIKQILDEINNMRPDENNGDIMQFNNFLMLASKVLPSTHSIIIDVKHKVAGILRDMMHRSVAVPKKIVKEKLDICREFLPLLDVLEPGISRLKAIALYEIYNPLVMISNMEFDAKEISSATFLSRLEEAEGYLKESIKYLLLEPISSPEATLCRRAMMELRNHKSNMDSIKVLVQEEQLFVPSLEAITFN